MRHAGKNVVVVAALIGAGFFLAWLRFRPHLGAESTFTDGQVTLQALGPDVRYAMWDDPVPLPPTVNTADPETRPALSKDGLYLVFSGGRPGLNRDLYACPLVDGVPGAPEPLALLNSPADEIAPAFAHDALWFASDRAGGAGGFDLYRCSYRDGVFGLPERLPDPVNTAADECDPFPVPGTDLLAFAAARERGAGRDFDLFLARPHAGAGFTIEALDAVNGPADEREPAFTRDGVSLLFASDRAGGAGDFDLYRSVRRDAAFLAPQPLGGVNSPRAERAPLPSEDGFSLLFAAGNDDLDLYRARSVELFRVPGRPVGWLDLLILAGLLAIALLAWLARRWEALDVLYKCMVVALLIHLLLLWYSKRVGVEGGDVKLPGRDALFQVRVASAAARGSHVLERGGRLEATARTDLAEAAPARAELPDAADVRPAAAPSRSLARAERSPAAEAAPDRQPGLDLQRSAAAPSAAVPLADAAEAVARAAEAAPQLALSSPAPTPMTRTGTGGGPERAVDALRSAAAVGTIVTGGSAPPRNDLAPMERGTDPAAAPVRSDVAPPPAAAAGPAVAAGPALRDQEAVTRPAAAASGGDPRDGVDVTPLSFAADRGRSTGPSRLDAELPELAAAGGSDGPPAPAPMRLERGTDLPPGEPASNPGTADAQPSRGAAPGLEIGLQDAAPGDRPRTADAAQGGAEGVALAAASFAPPSRNTPEGPARKTFAVAADAPAPMPPARTLPEIARVEPMASADLPGRRLEHTPYRNRFGLAKEQALQAHGGGAETEAAVADGLRYLASRQNDEGFWGTRDDYDEKYGYVCVGKSALCLLAFLGAGHYPGSGAEHEEVAKRAVGFLLSVQLEDGGHFGWTSAYSHGIATYALAECYALNKDDALRPALVRAVNEILRNQSDSRDGRLAGGWGYYNPEGNHYDRWSRVSVTAWQVMALESARLSGIDVPDAAFDRARDFLVRCWDPRLSAFRYSHDPTRLNSGYPTLPASTPAALFALSLLGEDIASAEFNAARRFVIQRRPREYRCRSEDAFVADASGNSYFWYYATLAMFRNGGEPWRQWNDALKATLLDSQDQDGSWRPICPYSERAMDTPQDRCYTTAMCVLSLEVYYRYFTPLLKVK